MSGMFKNSPSLWNKNKFSFQKSSNDKIFGKGLIKTTSSKLSGACGNCSSGGFAKGFCATILILAVLGVAVYLLMKYCDKNSKPKLKCMCQTGGFKDMKNSVKKYVKSFTSDKESFVRNLTPIYAAAGGQGKKENPLMTTPKDIKIIEDSVPEIKKIETFDTPQYAEDEPKEIEDSQTNNDEPPQYEVKKVSESGGKWASDKTEGERARGKIVKNSPFSSGEMKQRKVVEDGEEDIHYPVQGVATGNPRLNNKMLGAIMIDDRGEGVNLGVSKPIETFGPAISTNSRLAGSCMNLNPITGACFKTYNTETFFENNSAESPELNIMNGKPLTLKYDVNNTM